MAVRHRRDNRLLTVPTVPSRSMRDECCVTLITRASLCLAERHPRAEPCSRSRVSTVVDPHLLLSDRLERAMPRPCPVRLELIQDGWDRSNGVRRARCAEDEPPTRLARDHSLDAIPIDERHIAGRRPPVVVEERSALTRAARPGTSVARGRLPQDAIPLSRRQEVLGGMCLFDKKCSRRCRRLTAAR